MSKVGDTNYQTNYGQPVMAQPQSQSQNTTVIINAPGQQGTQLRDWSSGLCGCFEDIGSCLAVMFCGTCYACYLSTKLGESCCLPICLPGNAWLIALRTKVRSENRIMGNILNDCCMVAFCGQCVMCQLSREQDFIMRNPQLN